MPPKWLTTDPTDQRLGHSIDDEPVEQNDAYLVLPDEELESDKLVTKLRVDYVHICGTVTTIDMRIAKTWARDPNFYGATYCTSCKEHRPLSEFKWCDGTPMGETSESEQDSTNRS